MLTFIFLLFSFKYLLASLFQSLMLLNPRVLDVFARFHYFLTFLKLELQKNVGNKEFGVVYFDDLKPIKIQKRRFFLSLMLKSALRLRRSMRLHSELSQYPLCKLQHVLNGQNKN